MITFLGKPHNEYTKYEPHEEYTEQTVHRRQQVIHPLSDEDSKNSKSDDDIEQFGKTIDSTGAVVNKPSLKHETETRDAFSSKAIIAKIKEIQDKIFKRTGGNNKELEDKLRLMSPLENAEKASPSSELVRKQPLDVKGDRRKIIPEDVVDKILQKFQQLRSEAKHMALASDVPERKFEKDAQGKFIIVNGSVGSFHSNP